MMSRNRFNAKTQRRSHGLGTLLVLFANLPLFAQTNSETTNALPKLLPPYGEIPSTFWEQHGASVVVVALGAVVLAALFIWFLFRPKPRLILPPEVQARLALEALRHRAEDGACLSNVSQIARNYFIGAFQLPPGELTTAEFCRAISAHEPIGAEVSATVADFLRRCDEQKFSPAKSPAPLGAVTRALELIALGEARRVQLRQVAQTKIQEQRA